MPDRVGSAQLPPRFFKQPVAELCELGLLWSDPSARLQNHVLEAAHPAVEAKHQPDSVLIHDIVPCGAQLGRELSKVLGGRALADLVEKRRQVVESLVDRVWLVIRVHVRSSDRIGLPMSFAITGVPQQVMARQPEVS